MRIETFTFRVSQDDCREFCAKAGNSIGITRSSKKKIGLCISVGKTGTIGSKKFFKVGKEIRTVVSEIDMICIDPAASGADFKFRAAEVKMPVAGLVFV
jgi:hypothetical protein